MIFCRVQLFFALCILLTLSSDGSVQSISLGSFKQINLKNVQQRNIVNNVVAFALRDIKATEKLSKVRLLHIENAYYQIVSGMNYKVNMKVEKCKRKQCRKYQCTTVINKQLPYLKNILKTISFKCL
jgi:hypothetical protein